MRGVWSSSSGALEAGETGAFGDCVPWGTCPAKDTESPKIKLKNHLLCIKTSRVIRKIPCSPRYESWNKQLDQRTARSSGAHQCGCGLIAPQATRGDEATLVAVAKKYCLARALRSGENLVQVAGLSCKTFPEGSSSKTLPAG